jgi:hypothetical protein
VLIGAIKLTEVGSFYNCKISTFFCVLRWCREADPNVLCVGDVRHDDDDIVDDYDYEFGCGGGDVRV